jgi:HemY protein
MIRGGIVVLVVAALVVAVLALTGDPGRASLIWLGWRADMTAAVAVLLVFLGSLLGTIVWRTLLWILAAPERAAHTRAENRRRQAGEALSRGFLAAAAGDGPEARRLALKSAELAEETPALVRVLAAQAALAAGDDAAAEAAFQAMLGFPEMRLAGLKGLMDLAAARGDRDAALGFAEQAYGQARTARWAWRALFDARLAEADWAAALELVKGAQERKVTPPVIADRARAALLTALAARESRDARARAAALDHAQEATKLSPGFPPAAAVAAGLLARDGKPSRAETVLEQAWKARPHPALWTRYRDLRPQERPRARAERLRSLVALNPADRESHIVEVELALIAGDTAAAEAATAPLAAEPATARLSGLFARVAYAAGLPDEARVWMARGASAPHEPDWSDLDPEGRAFAWSDADWARAVAAYADDGVLIHPRYERGERVLSELPELPLSYAEAAPFLQNDSHEPVLYPVEEQAFAEDDPAEPGGPAPRRRSSGRRRLASGRRAAK